MKRATMFITALALAALASCVGDPEGSTNQSQFDLTGSGSGSGSNPPPRPPPPAPSSTITVTHHDGNPTSQNPGPPITTVQCDVPAGVLATLPIYNGNPRMTNCSVSVSASGNPPTSVSTNLHCSNSTGRSGYDYFTCHMAVTMFPPKVTQSGFFSYGATGAGSPALPDATCQAYIDRALAICKQTGKAP